MNDLMLLLKNILVGKVNDIEQVDFANDTYLKYLYELDLDSVDNLSSEEKEIVEIIKSHIRLLNNGKYSFYLSLQNNGKETMKVIRWLEKVGGKIIDESWHCRD